MEIKELDLPLLILHYTNTSCQNKALRYLISSLTPHQIRTFLSYWFADTVRPDNVCTHDTNYFAIAYNLTIPHLSHTSHSRYGISQTLYDTWRQIHHLPLQNIDYMPIGEAQLILSVFYWHGYGYSKLGLPLGITLFNTHLIYGYSALLLLLSIILGLSRSQIVHTNIVTLLKHHSASNISLALILARVYYKIYSAIYYRNFNILNCNAELHLFTGLYDLCLISNCD